MLRSNVIRVGLISLIFFIAIAIVWSLISRQQESTVLFSPELLSPEIARRSTKFEYSEHKAGRIVFTVDAETSTETVNRIHTLKKVSLNYFGDSSTPSDVISGEEAVYRIKDKLMEFSGDVRILLADGTKVFSERLSADLAKEVMTIEENFRFQRGKISGTGSSMVYTLPQRQIRVLGGLQLAVSSHSGHVEGGSDAALYRLRARVVELSGNSHILGTESRLFGDRLTFFLNEDGDIQKILSSGHCELQLGSPKSFSGDRINGFFGANPERRGYFEVLGGKSEGGSTRAVYRERTDGGVNVIESDRIVCSPRGQGILEWGALQRISAQGDVRLRLPQLGIEQSRAGHLVGTFFQDGKSVQQVSLKGAVSVTRRSGPFKSISEELQCESLRLQLESAHLLKMVTAKGNVHIKANSPGYYRHLLARDVVWAQYEDGLPKRVVARGGCTLESRNESEKNLLTAPSLEIGYRQGLVRRIVGKGGTQLVIENGGRRRRTRSDQVEVQYEKEKVERVIQSGGFHFWQEDPPGAELESAYATFEAVSEKITFGGDESPRLRLAGDGYVSASETFAQIFQLDQETGEIEGIGLVRSVFQGKDGLIIITAERMDANPEAGWINYYSRSRIVQGASTITGKLVRYSLSDQRLLVEDEVKSTFVEEDEFGGQRYRIAANHLVYEPAEFRARYEGKVRVETRDLFIEAPFVEFLFAAADSYRLQKMIAWGGVRIRGEDRNAEGERAIHFPYERKVVLTGDPARIVESAAGQATGSQLTFFVGDKRILVESSPDQSP